MKTYAEKRFFQWEEDKVSVTLRAKSGSYGGGQKHSSSKTICIGNGQADIATHITIEVAQTLSTMHDQLIVVILDE